ncbi:uncharacterized protein TNIN_446541 [Trichonephila inaurata madagascariensis]|uniref:Uncharacterized protein n=1 Tax=Trichonephila inaurata madagascariensis TaxID=2747483 RepID=A0A8X6WQ85_9ARAC|nr:uncharacterized protein TNIN_446541 [Trichonephila inaurata madagascariensis]
MDPSCSDLEFFDFNNASEEEVKEIQAILKGPGNNGCVELPWEIPIKENCIESLPDDEGVVEETDPLLSVKNTKEIGAVVGQALQFAAPSTPLSPPEAQLLPPPAVETYVTLPTTVGPYPSAPYFVSRTIPYLRAYPHMSVPFFACPIPGTGEAGPYGQFVPVVPATVGQEKFIGPIENESNQKNRGPVERQYSRRNKKKLSSTEYCGSFESETMDAYRELEHTDIPTPTSPINSDRPTSVPLVPLPVPPSTFAVAGGTLPMHGYPPGLHTLPYAQMSGPQAPSAAMYYVPVFNHPYSSYIPSPPSAPMVLPVNLRPETEVNELAMEKCSKVTEEVLENPSSLVVSSQEDPPNVQSNCAAVSSLEQYNEKVDVQPTLVDITAKNAVVEKEEVTDCNSSSDPLSSSPDCIQEVDDQCQMANEEIKESSRDPSRCWADLFKKPSPEVNGIDRRHDCTSTVKKDITSGKTKTYSVPVSDSIH